jgi:hypothetical protein
MTTNNNRHHIHHHEHLDEAEIYKRKNLSAAQRRKKLAKILFPDFVTQKTYIL